MFGYRLHLIVRTPPLLVSISLHGVAVLVTLVVGIYAQPFVRPPVARIEFRNTPPSLPAHTALQMVPDTEVEPEPDAQPLIDVRVPPVRPPEPEPVIHEPPLTPAPAAVLSQVSGERIRQPAPPHAEPAQPEVPAPASPPSEVQAPPSDPVFTAATRCDDGGPPAYPQRERRFGREGKVVLCVTVRSDGAVGDVSVKVPSRYSGFNRSAVKAVKTWRFEPATKDGVPIESVTDLEVVFQLR